MYETDELYEKARCEANRICKSFPQHIKEDAIQEYVIAAYEAGLDGCNNKSLQQMRGKSRMIDFLKYEARRTHQTLSESLDIEDALQLTPDEIVAARETYAQAGC